MSAFVGGGFIKKIAALLPLLLLPHAAYCGDTVGTISALLIVNDYPNLVFVTANGANSSLPSCSAYNRYVFDSSTTTGKQLYAAILAAKYANASITLIGLGTCSLVSNSEDLRGVAQN